MTNGQIIGRERDKARNDEALNSGSECVGLKGETGYNSHLQGRT